jgi:glycosyltransferase involved in cell wall biosynthesis
MARPVATVIGPEWSVHTQRWVALLETAGVEVALVSWSRHGGIRALLDLPRIWLSATRSVRRSQVTVVHTMGTHGLLSLFLPRAGRQVLVPWGSEVMVAMRSPTRRLIARRLVARSNVVLTTSREFARLVRELAPAVRAVSTISWGIDDLFLTPPSNSDQATIRGRWALPESAVLVFAPRGGGAVYRLEVIVQSFEEAARLRPNLFLVAVGDPADLSMAADTRTRVRLVGQLSQREMFELFSVADVVVSVPRWDQRSTAVLEGISRGAQILLSDVPAYREIIEDGAVATVLPEPLATSLRAAFMTVGRRDPVESRLNFEWAVRNENRDELASRLAASVLAEDPR